MEKEQRKIDFLAIGDIVIDAFIQLKDAKVHCNINNSNCELCVRFGDKIPYESVTVLNAVGNSPNASVSAARLGLSSALMTNLGDDQNGKDCLSTLEKEKIDTTFIKINKDKLTNYHYVLWYDIDRTILVKHQSYERKFPEIDNAPSWIYLSSMGEDSLPFHSEIIDYLKKNPDIKLAFQPGTYQMKFGTDVLKEIYEHTEIFFCNLEEAQRILKDETKEILELSKKIHALGPKIVSISDGEKGAYMYTNDELWHMPIYKDEVPPLERTGAGDAFSSTITVALALGKTPLQAFTWGPINSMSVVKQIGAQAGLLSREKLEEYLKNAPKEYTITKI
ncbi:MAG: carbohydrate kinase family protein [bacterium]